MSLVDDMLASGRVKLERARSALNVTMRESSGVSREATLAWLVALATGGSVLAIGSVHLPALIALAVVAFTAAAIACVIQVEDSRRPPFASLPVLTLVGLAAFTALQAASMPMSWLSTIAPLNADIWSRALLPLGEGSPRFGSLSLDPGASLVESLKWLTYAAIFTAASALGARRGGAWGVGVVFASAVLAAITTISHGLLGATKVFGLYQPTFTASAWHIGPLLNPNNLAGYLNLGAMCGLGVLLMHRPLVPPWAAALGVAVVMAVEILAGSRGGLLALLVGIAAVAALSWRRKKSSSPGAPGQSRARVLWLLGAVVCGGGALAALGGTHETWAELYDQNLQKLGVVRFATPLVRDFTWLGVGRGAFESVFPAYKATRGNIVHTHAENFPMQWIAEWGAPVGIAAMALFARSFSPRNVGAPRSAVATGAWVGLAVLLLQNLLDLALEIPAVCVALFVALGSLWGDGRRRRLPRSEGRAVEALSEGALRAKARVAAAATAALGLAAIAAVIAWGSHDLKGDRAAILDAYKRMDAKSRDARAAIRSELRAAMLRHPAEPYFPLMGALVAWTGRDQEPMPWLQRALERDPMNARAHLLLADVLAARKAVSQALLELRLVAENDPALVAPAAEAALRLTRVYEDLLRAVPEGKEGAATLDELGVRLNTTGDWMVRSRCDREAIARDPSLVGPRWREASELIFALGPHPRSNLCADRSWCDREIEAHAEAIALARPRSSLPAELRARKLLAEGRPDDAERLLHVECAKAADRGDCLRLRVEAAAVVTAGDRAAAADRVTAAVKDYLSASCVRSDRCADAATWAGDRRADRGEWGAAVALYSRAAREDPTEARYLKLADAATRSKAYAEAADALEKVAQKRGGADPELRRRIDEQRSLAAGVLIKP